MGPDPIAEEYGKILNKFISRFDSLKNLLTYFYGIASYHYGNDVKHYEQNRKTLLNFVKSYDLGDFGRLFVKMYRPELTPLDIFENIINETRSTLLLNEIRAKLIKIATECAENQEIQEYINLWILQPFNVLIQMDKLLTEACLTEENLMEIGLRNKNLFSRAVVSSYNLPPSFCLLSFVLYDEHSFNQYFYYNTGDIILKNGKSLNNELTENGEPVARIENKFSLNYILEEMEILRSNAQKLTGDDYSPRICAMDEGRRLTYQEAFEIMHEISKVWLVIKGNTIIYGYHNRDYGFDFNYVSEVARTFTKVEIIKIFCGKYSKLDRFKQYLSFSSVSDDVANSLILGSEEKAREKHVREFIVGIHKNFNRYALEAFDVIYSTVCCKIAYVKNGDQQVPRELHNLITIYEGMKTGKGLFRSGDVSAKDKMEWGIGFVAFVYTARKKYSSYNAPPVIESLINIDLPAMSGGSRKKTQAAEISPATGKTSEAETLAAIREKIREQLSGGTSTSDYANAIVTEQTRFNAEFVQIYKRLISAVHRAADNRMNATTVDGHQLKRALEDLVITSPLTTMKLSGLFKGNNYNHNYRKNCEGALEKIQESKLSLSEVASAIRSLANLLKQSDETATRLRNKYITAPKSPMELVFDYNDRFYLPCSLTSKELQELREAINRLEMSITNTKHETKYFNKDAQVQEFKSKVANRSSMIDAHYTYNLMMMNHLKNSDERSIYKSMIEITAKELKYINEVVDLKLLEWRKKIESNKVISVDQIQKIERIVVSYKNYKLSEKAKHLFRKLAAIRNNFNNSISLANIYSINSILRKIIIESGYIDLIESIYRELKIFGDDFDWNTFKNRMASLMVNSQIRVDNTFVRNGKFYSIYKVVTDWAKDFTARHYRGDDERERSAMFNFSKVVFDILGGDMLDNSTRKAGFVELREMYGRRIEGVEYLNKHLQGKPDRYIRMFNEINNDVRNIFNNYREIIEQNNQHYNIILNLINAVYPIIEEEYLLIPVDYNIENILRLIVEDIEGITDFEFTKTEQCTLEYDMFHERPNNEAFIINTVFESLIANVLNVFNKYIAVRYTGKFDLPLSYAMLGGNNIETNAAEFNEFGEDDNGETFGGDTTETPAETPTTETTKAAEDFSGLSADFNEKVRGASLMDVLDGKQIDDKSVVLDAVPFYIIALNIFAYYYTNYGKRYDRDFSTKYEKRAEIKIVFSELSVLYPVFRVYKDCSITNLSDLNDGNIRDCVGVFNRIWKQTSGNNAEKLSQSIDILLSELNASILLTTRRQYEILKQTGEFRSDYMDLLDENFSGFVDEISGIIVKTGFNNVGTNEQFAEFEQYLNNAMKQIQQDATDMARISTIKKIITEQDKYQNAMHDYYKFCELVLTPIVIAITGYRDVFDVFSYVASSVVVPADVLNNNDNSLDLEKIWINVGTHKDANIPDLVFGDLANSTNYLTVWEVVQNIRRGEMLYMQARLVNSTVVSLWNQIIMVNALGRSIIDRGRFSLPVGQLWLPVLSSTYPRQPVIQMNAIATRNGTYINGKFVQVLFEIYPNVRGATLYDYYSHAVREFVNDFKQLLTTFMSYPGISDKLIKALKDNIEKKIINLRDTLFPSVERYAAAIDRLKEVKLDNYNDTFTPLYDISTRIPPYPGKQYVAPLEVSQTLVKRKDNYKIGNGLYIVDPVSGTETADGRVRAAEHRATLYSALDYIMYELARCNPLEFTIPAGLLEIIMNNQILARELIPANIDNKNKITYNIFRGAVYYNVITQNIILRSSADKNSKSIKDMNDGWVATLVSVIPGLINYAGAALRLTQKGDRDEYDNDKFQVLSNIKIILEGYFNEIAAAVPFIPFLADFVPGNTYASIEKKLAKYHSIAEILNIMVNGDAMKINPIKTEWANRYFYTGLGIQFPEYKNKNKFESFYEWASSVLSSAMFRAEFESTIPILGKTLLRSIIIGKYISGTTQNVQMFDQDKTIQIIKICINAVGMLYEIDPDVITQFINNAIDLLQENEAVLMGGNSKTIRGGNSIISAAVANHGEMRMYYTMLRKLLAGIIEHKNDDYATFIYFPSNTDAARRIQSKEDLIYAAASLLNDYPSLKCWYKYNFDFNNAAFMLSNQKGQSFLKFANIQNNSVVQKARHIPLFTAVNNYAIADGLGDMPDNIADTVHGLPRQCAREFFGREHLDTINVTNFVHDQIENIKIHKPTAATLDTFRQDKLAKLKTDSEFLRTLQENENMIKSYSYVFKNTLIYGILSELRDLCATLIPFFSMDIADHNNNAKGEIIQILDGLDGNFENFANAMGEREAADIIADDAILPGMPAEIRTQIINLAIFLKNNPENRKNLLTFQNLLGQPEGTNIFNYVPDDTNRETTIKIVGCVLFVLRFFGVQIFSNMRFLDIPDACPLRQTLAELCLDANSADVFMHFLLSVMVETFYKMPFDDIDPDAEHIEYENKLCRENLSSKFAEFCRHCSQNCQFQPAAHAAAAEIANNADLLMTLFVSLTALTHNPDGDICGVRYFPADSPDRLNVNNNAAGGFSIDSGSLKHLGAFVPNLFTGGAYGPVDLSYFHKAIELRNDGFQNHAGLGVGALTIENYINSPLIYRDPDGTPHKQRTLALNTEEHAHGTLVNTYYFGVLYMSMLNALINVKNPHACRFLLEKCNIFTENADANYLPAVYADSIETMRAIASPKVCALIGMTTRSGKIHEHVLTLAGICGKNEEILTESARLSFYATATHLERSEDNINALYALAHGGPGPGTVDILQNGKFIIDANYRDDTIVGTGKVRIAKAVNDVRVVYLCLPPNIADYVIFNPQYELANLNIFQENKTHHPFNLMNFRSLYQQEVNGKNIRITDTIIGNLIDTYKPIAELHTLGSHNVLKYAINDLTYYFERLIQPAALRPELKQNVDEFVNIVINKIEAWARDLRDISRTSGYNSGFATNMIGGTPGKLNGGATLARRNMIYSDIHKAIPGDPYVIYTDIYGKDDENLKWYSDLFRKIDTDKNTIFALTMKYFNKTPISFASIYSQFLFPNCVFGSASFKSFVKKMADVIRRQLDINKLIDENKTIDMDRHKVLFIREFLTNFENNGHLVSDLCKQPWYDVKSKKYRKDDKFTFENVYGEMRRINENYRTQYLASIYTRPTIASSFFSQLVDIINGKEVEEQGENNTSLIYLLDTYLFGMIKSLDSIVTYMSVISMLVKYLSYYDSKEFVDKPYTSVEIQEPFNTQEQF